MQVYLNFFVSKCLKNEKETTYKQSNGLLHDQYDTHCPHRRGEAQNSRLHALRHKRHNVLSQTSISKQSPQDVQSVDLSVHSNTRKHTMNERLIAEFKQNILCVCVCLSTCGTVLMSVDPSSEGMANAVRDLMVIFRRLQLEDFGSEDSKAFTQDQH